MTLPRLMVAAPSRGSGKSTVAIGIAAALRARGRAVQPFKKGPDFIDPMWLSAAAGRRCRNLDFFMMGGERIAAAFPRRAAGVDLALVEANHGLHDGIDPAGADSGAALARLLGLPVLLVLNAQRLGRGIAPLVQGQIAFDPAVNVAGVVLNNVRGARHEGKLRDAVERYCRVEVVGVLPELPELAIAERHLGLTPLDEVPDLAPIVERIGAAVAQHLDLDRIEMIARSAPDFSETPGSMKANGRDAGHVSGNGFLGRHGSGVGVGVARRGGLHRAERSEHDGGPQRPPQRRGGRQDPGAGNGRVRIGIAMDRAFTFYYPENLEALTAAGADLIPFSPLDDPRLPPVAGLYFGGGFPEVFMERLEANATMREDVRRAITAGTPTWAECGGLMYLTQGITWRDRRAAMAGVFSCAVEMHDRPAGHGYVVLEETACGAWPSAGRQLRGHEFHHSRLVGLDTRQVFAYRVLRGAGAVKGFDGLVHGSCVAGYTHLHADGAPQWATDFVTLIREKACPT